MALTSSREDFKAIALAIVQIEEQTSRFVCQLLIESINNTTFILFYFIFFHMKPSTMIVGTRG